MYPAPRQKVVNPAFDAVCSPTSISTHALLPATADDGPPPADWESYSREASSSTRFRPGASPVAPQRAYPRSRPSRTSVPVIPTANSIHAPSPEHVPVPRQRSPCPVPSERKHAAPSVRLSVENARLKVRTPYSHRTRQLPSPQQQAVNPAPNEASTPYPAASGHGSVPRQQGVPRPSGTAPPASRQQHPGSDQWDHAGQPPHAARPPRQSFRTEQVQNKRIPPP